MNPFFLSLFTFSPTHSFLCTISKSVTWHVNLHLPGWCSVQTHDAVVSEHGTVHPVIVFCTFADIMTHNISWTLFLLIDQKNAYVFRVIEEISSSSRRTALMHLCHKKIHPFDIFFVWVPVPQSLKLLLVSAVNVMLLLTEVRDDGALLKWQALMRNNSSYYSVPRHTTDWSTIFFLFFLFSGIEAMCKGGLIIKNVPSSKLSWLSGWIGCFFDSPSALIGHI